MNLCHFLGWCVLLNYGVLSFWFLAFVCARDRIYRLHSVWFRLSESQFDALHYGAMGFYKLTVLFFNLVPYLILRFLPL